MHKQTITFSGKTITVSDETINLLKEWILTRNGINGSEILHLLSEDLGVPKSIIGFYNHDYISILEKDMKDRITNFISKHPNGKIVIVGKAGSGKTTLQVDISLNISHELDMYIPEINNVDYYKNLDKFNLYTHVGHSIANVKERFYKEFKTNMGIKDVLFLQVNQKHNEFGSTSTYLPTITDYEIVKFM